MAKIATIIAGGIGSRLWPLSRKNLPKPFIKVKDDLSFYQILIKRIYESNLFDEIQTVSTQDYYHPILDDINEINPKIKLSFVLEKEGKNTYPAILYSCFDLNLRYNNSTQIIFPADQFINKQSEKKFNLALNKSFEIVSKNDSKIILFGIRPNKPETGYGYIQTDKRNNVLSFLEKPSLRDAEKLIKNKNIFWNSGMFCFKTNEFLEISKKINFNQHKLLEENFKLSKKRKSSVETIFDISNKLNHKIKNISIDYAIIEKYQSLMNIPLIIKWSDVGSLISYTDLIKKDRYKNNSIGDNLILNSSNTSIISHDKPIVSYGVKNLIIINNHDFTFIIDKKNISEMRNIFNKVENLKPNLMTSNYISRRPWGYFINLFNGEKYKVKHIVVKPKQSISLQKHNHRYEHWTVVKGVAKVIIGKKTLKLKTNQSVFIPKKEVHQIINETNSQIEIIEVQTGSILREDDITRYKDKYGRI